MLAVDELNNIRKFGSRRHYCFSHEGYREACSQIVSAIAERYGRNPYVATWQTDNEYGCHHTTFSYNTWARNAFRECCRKTYKGQGGDGEIPVLNTT